MTQAHHTELNREHHCTYSWSLTIDIDNSLLFHLLSYLTFPPDSLLTHDVTDMFPRQSLSKLAPGLSWGGSGQWLAAWPAPRAAPPPGPPPGHPYTGNLTRSTGLSVTLTSVTGPPRTPGLTRGPWCLAQCPVCLRARGLTTWCLCRGQGPDTTVTLSPGLRF